MIKSKEQGLLIVVSGPSGCGKSTLDQLLIERRNTISVDIIYINVLIIYYYNIT